MINVEKLQDKLISDPTKIVAVVEELGYPGVKDRGKYISARNPDGDNNNAITVLKSTLQYHNYTRGKQGNIFTLIMDTKGYNFPEALEWICKILGEDKNKLNTKVHYPFNGFYRKIIQSQTNSELTVKTYSESCLPDRTNLSKLWLDDGVDLLTQETFGIRYDHATNGIVIPEYAMDGSLVGAKWRNNDKNCKADERWGMYIPFSKSYILYGLHVNYPHIASKRRVVVFEAEKSVCQMYGWGYKYAISIGGHSFSDAQVRQIKALMCDEIVISFDEGIEEDEIIYEARKLMVDNQFYSNTVSYIYDENHKYLEKGSKDSPTDRGIDIFKSLIKERITL